ncbi:MAG: hypothetical protein L6Q76_22410 [Polyangiaceae bacterium]|nr:hypothetical protein [Polyangiaceae bacterium]
MAGAASAEVPREGVRLDLAQPAPPESTFFRAAGPHETRADDEVEFAFGLGLEYAKDPLRTVAVDAAGGERVLASLVDHAVFARIGASIAPIRWISFDLSIPFALYETGDARTVTYAGSHVAPPSTQGIGDPRVGLRARFIDTETFDLHLGARAWAPIGSSSAYLSDHRIRAEAELGVAGELSKILYGCSIGIAPGFFLPRDGDRIAASCGVHAKLTPALSAGLEPSVVVLRDIDGTGAAGTQILIEPLAAAQLRAGDFRISLGGGPGFGGAPGTAELRMMFGVAYVGVGRPEEGPAAVADRDLDTIPDQEDACPAEAGPKSKTKDRHGCPAQDRDGDSVRDGEDYCPDRPGVAHADPKGNGCPDSDNDAEPDPIDGCPTEPGAPPMFCPKYARLSGSAFKINPAIEFRGEALTPAGTAALEEIAATMRANPKLEQVSISLGTKGVRSSISDARAQKIILIFRANLDTNRFEVVLRDDQRGGLVQARIVR